MSITDLVDSVNSVVSPVPVGPNEIVPWDFTIRHIALVLTEFRLRLFLFLFAFSFLPLFNMALSETSV